MKPLTLSIVIPVFNESHHIVACLTAISKQLDAPDEVIVIDNNSSDDTVDKAQKFDFVRVVKEHTQGITAARNKGFGVATSDIIGRIDADAVLNEDWVANVKRAFEDSSVSAATGVANTRTLSETKGFYSHFWSGTYLLAINAFFRVPILWGANMAIRRTAWLVIKDVTCPDDHLVHEDQDLSLVLAAYGLRVVQDKKILIKSNEWSYHRFSKLNEYLMRDWKTLRYRKKMLKNAKVKKFSIFYSLAVFTILIIPGIFFYLSSVIYFVFSPIYKLMRKRV